ncbi:MAG: restriction endonuclease subunit S [Sphingobacteriaceae bacterium]|nr:restriction endonuclease subunit S [Sphingobacteriaceae bacterium]
MGDLLNNKWNYVELQHLASIKSGGTPSRSNKAYWNGDIPWLKISDFNDLYIRKSEEFISKIGLDNSSARIFPKGTILFTIFATIGKIGILDFEAATNQAIAGITPNDHINHKYLVYSLKQLSDGLQDVGKGVAQKNINLSILKETKIPLPPLAEQERIVAKLDKLFAQVEVMKKALERIPQLLKDFRQQVLTQAVTGKLTEEWRRGKNLVSHINIIKENRIKNFEESLKRSKKEKLKKPRMLVEDDFDLNELDKSISFPTYWILENLKNICDFITDGEHATPKRTEQGYFLLSARNVRDGFLSLENVDYVNESEFKRISQRCNPEYKDVLISCSGSVGRVAQFPNDLEAVMVRSAALLKLQSNIEISKFVEFALRSNVGQNQVEKLTKSTAQSNLFLEPIGKIVIPIPDLQEQNEIVFRVESLLDKADKIEEKYKALKTKIATFPQTILHKAFTGELVEQLPTDGDAKDLLAEIMAIKTSK